MTQGGSFQLIIAGRNTHVFFDATALAFGPANFASFRKHEGYDASELCGVDYSPIGVQKGYKSAYRLATQLANTSITCFYNSNTFFHTDESYAFCRIIHGYESATDHGTEVQGKLLGSPMVGPAMARRCFQCRMQTFRFRLCQPTRWP